jgi:hypothetical protein
MFFTNGSLVVPPSLVKNANDGVRVELTTASDQAVLFPLIILNSTAMMAMTRRAWIIEPAL